MLRRFAIPMGLVLLALLFLLTRVYEVSVDEHSIWAREAASLERGAHLLPYRRGRILDRSGNVWVNDQVRYEVEFVWRNFRRGHPLGNIVQLMSLTLMRPVDLQELADGDAALWADHLVGLSPDQIRSFGRGGALVVGGMEIEELPEEGRRGARREERRPARAADLRFYIERLLGVTRREWQQLRDLRDSDRSDEPYANLVAGLRRTGSESFNAAVQRLRRELRERVDRSLLHLEELGALVDWTALEEERGLALGTPLERVVQVLDGAREESENKAADRLFFIAAKFPARHLSPGNLRALDLGWLKKCLYWDAARLEEWRMQRGGAYARDVRRHVAGYVFARMQLTQGEPADRVLDALAHEFVHASDRVDPRVNLVTSWRRADRLRTLGDLPLILEDWEEETSQVDVVLPFQDPRLRDGDHTGRGLLHASLQSMGLALGGRVEIDRLVTDLLDLPGNGSARRTDWQPGELEPIERVLMAWNDRLDHEVTLVLESLPQPVLFHEDRVRGALEDRDHVIKDMSSRPLIFAEFPSTELVHHVERYHQDYVGLQVRGVHSRSLEALVPSDDPLEPDRLLAAGWIGKVRSPKLVSLLERGGQEAQARELWRKTVLDEQDREFVVEAAAQSYMPSQTVGGSGIEGYYDRELRGRNGFREEVGLQETRGPNAHQALYRAPQDGLDIMLTLDMDMQRAAEDVINHPVAPPGDDRVDPVWMGGYSVGAIVAMTPDGQVLAAASAPVTASEPGIYQDEERGVATDRVMRMPKFLPPGSVMKPMVAAWALQYLGLNPDRPRVICSASTTNKKKKDWAGYGSVSCHRRWGHSTAHNAEAGLLDVNLQGAILVSCNTYFAQVGDTLYDEQEFQKMFDAFGFGRRTGIMNFGQQGRSGWLEDYDYHPMEAYSPTNRQRLANGLTHVEVTPLQMARAYAGLATGVLPNVRVVLSIGDRDVPATGETLPIDAVNLEIVRSAMANVANKRGGSAFNKGLGEADLGMRFVCKTGSADYKSHGMVPDPAWSPSSGRPLKFVEGTRKHTWVVGWLPENDPKLVVVAFVHDTSTTSSHSAVYVMAQFLTTPAIQAYLGVER